MIRMPRVVYPCAVWVSEVMLQQVGAHVSC